MAVQLMSGGLLIPPGPLRVLVATKPVDFRRGMNGLAALVQEQLKANPFSGTIYCFRSKRADRVTVKADDRFHRYNAFSPFPVSSPARFSDCRAPCFFQEIGGGLVGKRMGPGWRA
jgi:IS66 Orf2 like protein